MQRVSALCAAALSVVCLAGPGVAGPFTEVPRGHWAYSTCAGLASLGIIPASQARSFSGDPPLTRYEFGLALFEPLSRLNAMPDGEKLTGRELVSAAANALGIEPARVSEEELAQAGADLLRLSTQFEDVLPPFLKNLAPARRVCGALSERRAVTTWRRGRGLAPSGRSLSSALGDSSLRPAGTVALPLAGGRVRVSLSEAAPPPIMDLLATSASGRTDGRLLAASSVGGETAGIADPRVRRLGTSYEYGLGDDLTLSLQYESFARTGRGFLPLDTTTLATLGLGYRLSPSTSLKLRYGILDYVSQQSPEATRLRERLAETSVSVEF